MCMRRIALQAFQIMEIFKVYRVSAKYLIRRDGTVIELVPDNHKAYHAGYSRMNGRDGCNNFTDSFELEGGIGFDYEDEQILSVGELLAQSMTKNQYTLDWVQGHDKVRSDWLDIYPSKAVEKHVSRKDVLFSSQILKAKLIAVSDPKIARALLEKQLQKTKDNLSIAELNYELFIISGLKKFRKKALGLYKRIYKTTPNFEYKNRITKLE